MKNLGIAAILVGIIVLILGLLGVLGAGTRTPVIAAVIFVVAGWFLYKRGQRGTSA